MKLRQPGDPVVLTKELAEMRDGLTGKQASFAEHYVAQENRKTARECAILAGYPEKSARAKASQLQNPKLFPKVQLLELGHELPDYTTGASFYQPIADVSNITRFNKDPYRTWRSAFRECVKLASSVNPNQKQKETDERLEAWCTTDVGARFGRYCLKGALEGKAYGLENKDDTEALNKINDFEWLREQFVASMKKRVTDK